MPRSILTLMLCLTTLAHAGPGEDTLRSAVESGSWTQAREALLASNDLASEDTLRLQDDASWRVALAAHALDAWRTDPAGGHRMWTAEPMMTRTGAPRFGSDIGPSVWVMERLVLGQDPTEVRVALVDALIRSEGPWAHWITHVVLTDPAPEVRRIATEILRHTSPEAAKEALLGALQDAEPGVRAASVRAIGRLHPDAALKQALLDAATDPDDEVAGYAARSLGWLRAENAYETIAALLVRSNDQTRVHALRALERIDSQRAAIDPRVHDRCTDTSSQVKKVTQTLTEC